MSRRQAMSRKVHASIGRLNELVLDCLDVKKPKTYNEVFEIIWPKMRETYPNSGEETMRLRAYEVLLNLVARGKVVKTGKEYTKVKEAPQGDE